MVIILYVLNVKVGQVEVVRRLEKNVKLKEARLFSQKCHSQILITELFPQKNDCKKFTEQCKMNFFFPDADSVKVEELARIKQRERQQKTMKKGHSLI